MSQRNQEVKRVYMLKDNILLKDEQLKRKKKQIMKMIVLLWRSRLHCVSCALNCCFFVCIFLFNLYIGTNVFLYMVPDIDNLMLAEDGTKLPCNGV